MQLTDHEVATVLGRLRIRTGGSGPAIVFWPSLLMDGSLWSAQAEYFGSSGWRVVLVDPPRHGASEPLTGPFSFSDCAHCVVEVLDELGLETAHFVGNSWGGMIGGTFAALYPGRIGRAVSPDRLNVAGGLGGPDELHRLAVRAAPADRVHAAHPMRPPARRHPPSSRETCRQGLHRADNPAYKAIVVATIRATARRVNVDSVFWAVTSVAPQRPDQRGLFASIRTPVLVVAGAEDATFPVAETRAMADAIPGSSFVVLEGAAHLAALEVPDRVNALVQDFLSR